MQRMIDLSPRVPAGFKGPPSTGVGVRFEVRIDADRLEGVVNLHQLPPRCQSFAPFYHFAGIDSAPARAFALVDP